MLPSLLSIIQEVFNDVMVLDFNIRPQQIRAMVIRDDMKGEEKSLIREREGRKKGNK